MRQSTITLRQAIERFPKSWSKVKHQGIPDDFNKLDFVSKQKYLNEYDDVYYLSVKENQLFFGLKNTSLKRSGRNIYKSNLWTNVIVVTPKSVKVSKLDTNSMKVFYNILDVNFIQDLTSKEFGYLMKPTIIGAILRKKVYSIETYYKCILSNIYKIKNVSWRLFREFTQLNFHTYSVLDLFCFTKDISKSMQILIKLSSERSRSFWVINNKYNLIIDLIDCAIKLNEVVDLTWSDKRLEEEHKRQNAEFNLQAIKLKDNSPIFDTFLDTDTIKLLNTEKDVFLEGTNMHHCLYNCYWDSIKRKKYIAFHMTSPEDCTFSFKKISADDLILHQIYLAYDKSVKEETRAIALNFMHSNKSKILSLLESFEDRIF